MWSSTGSLSSSERAKELLEKSLALRCFNISNDAGRRAETIVETEVVERANGTLSRVAGTKDDNGYAGESNRSEAHRTRFKGDAQDAVVESPRAEFFGRFSDCVDLRVRDDRLVLFGGVASRSDDRVVVRDDGTDGNFPSSGRAFCVANRFVHEVVDEIWGGWGVHGISAISAWHEGRATVPPSLKLWGAGPVADIMQFAHPFSHPQHGGQE